MVNKPHIQVPNYNSIEKVESYWNSLKPQSVSTSSYEEKWLTMAPFFDTVSLQSRVCVTLWNASTNRFIYAVDKTKVLGENAIRFTDVDGVDFSIGNFHPDHLEALLLLMQKGIQYCFEKPEHLPYKIILNLDVLYKINKGYIHILQQASVVETDDNKQPLLWLSYLYDITHIKKGNSANMVVKTPDEILIWNYLLNERKLEIVKPLTHQEKNVLNLLAQGNQTKEIAKKLFISHHTVDTHRRNLLTKTNCIDTTGLVSYARMTGLI
jgi:DNA-binding CsgD family transcriptional regulator